MLRALSLEVVTNPTVQGLFVGHIIMQKLTVVG